MVALPSSVLKIQKCSLLVHSMYYWSRAGLCLGQDNHRQRNGLTVYEQVLGLQISATGISLCYNSLCWVLRNFRWYQELWVFSNWLFANSSYTHTHTHTHTHTYPHTHTHTHPHPHPHAHAHTHILMKNTTENRYYVQEWVTISKLTAFHVYSPILFPDEKLYLMMYETGDGYFCCPNIVLFSFTQHIKKAIPQISSANQNRKSRIQA
jgi:hypothetical protein